jgi:hypothetical protein
VTRATTVLGVSIDGYAVEGGYDVEGGPATSFGVAQSLGRTRPSLRSDGTFVHLDDLVRRAAQIGCQELRLTMEWARLERRPGQHDDDALARYLGALRTAQAESMSAVVVLCDATLPSWMGHEPWLSAWAADQFAAHAAWVAHRVEGLARSAVTFRAPNAAAREGWRTGRRPPHRTGADLDSVSALDGMLVAHQRAATAMADAAPTLGRALIFEAAPRYDDSAGWHDVADGLRDPVLVGARRDRWDAMARGTRGARAANRRGAGQWLRDASQLRSTPGWTSTAPFEWWLCGDDPDLLVASLAFGAQRGGAVELGAGRFGWDAQLAAGLQAVTSGEFGATTVHLHGLVSSTGPLDAPTGLLAIDQHNGAWTVGELDDGIARRLLAPGPSGQAGGSNASGCEAS